MLNAIWMFPKGSIVQEITRYHRRRALLQMLRQERSREKPTEIERKTRLLIERNRNANRAKRLDISQRANPAGSQEIS